ncbi:MAG TPA: hypothetical protein VK540_12820 [Polyangiaceae bacterium]|nr:hypothetical protein [Polyangiaceae bacterium]
MSGPATAPKFFRVNPDDDIRQNEDGEYDENDDEDDERRVHVEGFCDMCSDPLTEDDLDSDKDLCEHCQYLTGDDDF